MHEESSPVEICGQGHGDHFFRLEGPHLPAPGALEGNCDAKYYRGRFFFSNSKIQLFDYSSPPKWGAVSSRHYEML